MSDPTSIFGNTDPQKNDPANQPNSNNVQNLDSMNDLLASVKNERGEQKYKDLNEAINGLKHAQEYIPTLKGELSAKEQALAAAQAEIERLRAVEETVRALSLNPGNTANTPVAPALDENKLAELVQKQIQEREVQTKQQSNVQEVVSTLQSVFGSDAEKAFYGKAQELGMTTQEMNALAARSPKAVLKMLGIDGAQKLNVAPNTGSVNSSAFTPKQDSFVGRNPKSAMIGATTEDLREAANRSKKMVDELHSAGLSVHDLSDPKVYAKYFGKH